MKHDWRFSSLAIVLLLQLECSWAIHVYQNNEYEVSDIDKRLDIPHPVVTVSQFHHGHQRGHHRHGVKRHHITTVVDTPTQPNGGLLFRRQEVPVPEGLSTPQHHNRHSHQRHTRGFKHHHKPHAEPGKENEFVFALPIEPSTEVLYKKSEIPTIAAYKKSNVAAEERNSDALASEKEVARHEIGFAEDLESLTDLVRKAEKNIEQSRSSIAAKQHPGQKRQEIIHALDEGKAKSEPEDDIEALGRRMDETGHEIKDAKYEQTPITDKHAAAATRYIISKIQEIQDKLFKRTGNKELEDKLNQMAQGDKSKKKESAAITLIQNMTTVATTPTNSSPIVNNTVSKAKTQTAERRKIIPEEVVDKILEKFQQLKKEAKHMAVSKSRHSVEHAAPLPAPQIIGTLSERTDVTSWTHGGEKYSFVLPLSSIQPATAKSSSSLNSDLQIPLHLLNNHDQEVPKNRTHKPVVGVPIVHLRNTFYLVPAFGKLKKARLTKTTERVIASSYKNVSDTLDNIKERLDANPHPTSSHERSSHSLPTIDLMSSQASKAHSAEKEIVTEKQKSEEVPSKKMLCIIDVRSSVEKSRILDLQKVSHHKCNEIQLKPNNHSSPKRKYTYYGTKIEFSNSVNGSVRGKVDVLPTHSTPNLDEVRSQQRRQVSYEDPPVIPSTGSHFSDIASQMDSISPGAQNLVSHIINNPDIRSAMDELNIAKARGEISDNPFPFPRAEEGEKRTMYNSENNLSPDSPPTEYDERHQIFQGNEEVVGHQEEEFQRPSSMDYTVPGEARSGIDYFTEENKNKIQGPDEDGPPQTPASNIPFHSDVVHDDIIGENTRNEGESLPHSAVLNTRENLERQHPPVSMMSENFRPNTNEPVDIPFTPQQERSMDSERDTSLPSTQRAFDSMPHENAPVTMNQDTDNLEAPRHFSSADMGRKMPENSDRYIHDMHPIDTTQQLSRNSVPTISHDELMLQHRIPNEFQQHFSSRENAIPMPRSARLRPGMKGNLQEEITPMIREKLPMPEDQLPITGNRPAVVRNVPPLMREQIPAVGDRRNSFPKLSEKIAQFQEETNRMEREYEMLKMNTEGAAPRHNTATSTTSVPIDDNHAPLQNLPLSKSPPGLRSGEETMFAPVEDEESRAKQLEEVNQFAGRESVGGLATKPTDAMLDFAIQSLPDHSFMLDPNFVRLDLEKNANYESDRTINGAVRHQVDVMPNNDKLSLKSSQRAILLKRINALKNELDDDNPDSNGYKRNLKTSLSRSSLPVGSLAAISVDHPRISIVPSNVHNFNEIAPVFFQQSQRQFNRNNIIHPVVEDHSSSTKDDTEFHKIDRVKDSPVDALPRTSSLKTNPPESSQLSMSTFNSSNTMPKPRLNSSTPSYDKISPKNNSISKFQGSEPKTAAYNHTNNDSSDAQPISDSTPSNNGMSTTKSSVQVGASTDIKSVKASKNILTPYSDESMTEVINDTTPLKETMLPMSDISSNETSSDFKLNELRSPNISSIKILLGESSSAKKMAVSNRSNSTLNVPPEISFPFDDTIKELKSIKNFYEEIKNGSRPVRRTVLSVYNYSGDEI